MKQTVKMSRAVGQLEKMYNTINTELFNGELPVPVITVQSRKGTWGHCSVRKIWRNESTLDRTYEMNIAADSLSGEIEEIVDTIIHEMVHLYCREKGIKECSRGGAYHNKKFKDIAESKMLVCTYSERIGWNTVGHGNDKLTEYCLEHGWSELMICRDDGIDYAPSNTGTTVDLSGLALPVPPTVAPTSTSNVRKYQCPKCGNSVRATKDVNIICGDCMVQMILARKGSKNSAE